MYKAILTHFPAHVHPLTLVSDPDGVLNEEEILTNLAERGFTLIREPDPAHLRHRVEEARPFTDDHPLIVVTDGEVKTLPYDLWQKGHRVTLALHTFFPNLVYPVLQQLTSEQRWRLSQAPAPERRLGRRGTMDYILRHVFEADLDALDTPAVLVDCLNRYHERVDAMPQLLVDHLLGHLRRGDAYTSWPLEDLLTDREAFTAFVQSQWQGYVQAQTGQLLSEDHIQYVLSFDSDSTLQDTVPGLVRSGTLTPVQIERPDRLPGWARSAVLAADEDRRPRRVGELLEALEELLGPCAEGRRWEQWQAIARVWAELNTLRYDPDVAWDDAQQDSHHRLQGRLDTVFWIWLQQRYAPLGGQRLPEPHHLYHVPHFMAYQQRQGETDRVALLILDGMALTDWHLIGPAWRARHSDWRFRERLVLAQVPTITCVSRQALVSGLRPADFADTIGHNRVEGRQWAAFWAGEEIPSEACLYAHLPLAGDGSPDLNSTRYRALCLIDNALDDMLHGASLGAADVQASLCLWLKEHSERLERTIDGLLNDGYTVYLTSDHGHIEAHGMGQPSEGLTVQTRSRRARIYADHRAMANVQQVFPDTINWSQDGLLPGDVWILMPQGRQSFGPFGETIVTHGGPTLEETIVPLITITRG